MRVLSAISEILDGRPGLSSVSVQRVLSCWPDSVV